MPIPVLTVFCDGSWPWALAVVIELGLLVWVVRGLIKNGIL